jgi:hypothetical protein
MVVYKTGCPLTHSTHSKILSFCPIGVELPN